MPAQPRSQHSNMRQSMDVPISAFNKQLIEEAGRISVSRDRDRVERGHSNASRSGRRTSKRHSRSASAGAVSRHDSNRASMHQQQHTRRSISEQQSSTVNNKSRYVRPSGPELVSSKHPSCLGLPQAWDHIHDRLIAYLATHAPLDKNGKIPRHEEKRERWRTEDIALEVVERFPRLGCRIKPSTIEKRLNLLDQAGDNDYFKIPYGAYRYEEWGHGI